MNGETLERFMKREFKDDIAWYWMWDKKTGKCVKVKG